MQFMINFSIFKTLTNEKNHNKCEESLFTVLLMLLCLASF